VSADRPLVIEPAAADSAEVQELLASYLAEIVAAFAYNAANEAPTTAAEFTPPNGNFLVVRDSDGRGVGCGAVRRLDSTTAEIKRMWLHPSIRGRGAGRQLLAALEAAAVDLGAEHGRLDTNAALATAIALYRRCGWVDVPSYNDSRVATHWFAKDLRRNHPVEHVVGGA
jgi:GNAT superfamily N-acetyltransferase